MFECKNCGGKRFILTETTTITTSMIVDLSDGEDFALPDFKSNQVNRQYTLICVNCGKVYMYQEGDYVNNVFGYNKEGIIVDVYNTIVKIKEEGFEGKCNGNLNK